MSYIEKFWRDATAADIARVIAGERAITARFRNAEDDLWQDYYLSGVNGKRWLGGNFGWTFCQVYAPPQWFLDKPDPGDEFRLLGKFPDEPVHGGDFFKNAGGRWIELANGCNPTQQEGIWYRRRIEQPKPEPKHYVLQVGDTADVPSGHRIAITEHGLGVT